MREKDQGALSLERERKTIVLRSGPFLMGQLQADWSGTTEMRDTKRQTATFVVCLD